VVAADEPATSIFRPASDEDDEPEEERRRRWPLVLLVLVILALLAAAIAVGLQLFGGGKETQVPQVTNMTLRAAAARLEQEDLKIGEVDRVNSDDVPSGRIVSQSPSPGSTVEAGSTVDVKVSAGSKQSVVPYVVGSTRAEASQKLDDAGLVAEFRNVDSEEPRGQVVDQDPVAGSSVPTGSSVAVSISNGPVEVPNVVGLQQDAAEAKLRKAGFEVAVEFDDETPSDSGTVLRQDPDGLTTAPRGSTVTITVSNYSEPSSSPATPTGTPTETPTKTPTKTPTETPDGIGGTVGPGGG
jgi:serine/threonine-protein kinase